MPRRQHTVTKAILKRFADPKTKRLEEYDFPSDTHSPEKPNDVGYVLDFIDYDAQRFEDKWQKSEQKIGAIYEAFRRGALHTDAKAIDAAKNLIALHAARSRTMSHVINLSRERSRQALIGSLLGTQQTKLAEAFQQRTGFIATGFGALQLQAEWEANQAASTTEGGQFFGWRVETNFDDLKDFLSRTSIQVLVASPTSRRFMIGDDPCPSMKAHSDGLGPLGGVPWKDATTIVLPLSPDFAIALRDKPETVELSDDHVEFLNRVQMSNAETSVFYRSDPQLRTSAQQIRPLKQIRTGSFPRRLLPTP